MICSACRQLARRPLLAASVRRRATLSTWTTVPSSAASRTLSLVSARSPAQPHGRTALSSAISSTRRRFSAAPASAASDEPPAAAASPAPGTAPLQKPDFLDEAESHIWDLLVEAFNPAELSVRDISGGCGSMYGIEISSEAFRGANMLKQQRMVNAALGDLVKGWHGLQLKTRAP